MKVHWHRMNKSIIGLLAIVLFCVLFISPSLAQIKLLSRKEALIIAESTKEVELFYKMHNGRLKNCIDKEVIKPCESNWVTCIENAWVVQFTVSDICPIEHDERLGITILIDAVTGKVISRFPEADYFIREDYCLEEYDCVCDSMNSGDIDCKNFVHANKSDVEENTCESCKCRKNRCIYR